ncbi:MAG: hypothetical protein ABIR87_00495 [Sphingomicrobium sp.]
MNDKPSAAGGFFLIVAILAGFGIGAHFNVALVGAIAGTLVGTLIAIAIWLKDRRRPS